MKFFALFAVFTLLFAATLANTDINFYFADMLAGVGGGSGSGNPSVPSNDTTSDDAFAIEQTIYGFFALNDYASNDPPVNVVASKYAAFLVPFTSESVTLTTSTSIINNGAPTSYSGINGVVNYLHDVALTRNSSRQLLSNLVYTFGSSDYVTVTAVFTGIESLNSNYSFQSFYGHRTYQLVRNVAGQYGWLIVNVNVVRDVTRPSPEFTATFRGDVQNVVLALVDLNDAASNDNASNVNNANYGALVSPLVTSDFSVSSSQPATGTVTYGQSTDSTPAGSSAFIAYLQALSTARAASQTDLSSFEFSFNYDQSVCTVNAKASGYEVLAAGGQDIFYGTRMYTVVRGDDGVWRVSSLVAVRSATFTQ